MFCLHAELMLFSGLHDCDQVSLCPADVEAAADSAQNVSFSSTLKFMLSHKILTKSSRFQTNPAIRVRLGLGLVLPAAHTLHVNVL